MQKQLIEEIISKYHKSLKNSIHSYLAKQQEVDINSSETLKLYYNSNTTWAEERSMHLAPKALISDLKLTLRNVKQYYPNKTLEKEISEDIDDLILLFTNKSMQNDFLRTHLNISSKNHYSINE